jgi:hypothetical protein
MGWMVWKERNARTFRGENLSAIELALAIKEAFQWDQSGYKSFKSLPAARRYCFSFPVLGSSLPVISY